MFPVESQKETKNVEPKIKKVRTETVLVRWYSDNLKPFLVTSLARGSLLKHNKVYSYSQRPSTTAMPRAATIYPRVSSRSSAVLLPAV